MTVEQVTPTHIFRGTWPIFDHDLDTPINELAAVARRDLPRLAAQQHARLIARGKWRVVDSTTIPGSGRITANVLVYEAPAVASPPRCYRNIP